MLKEKDQNQFACSTIYSFFFFFFPFFFLHKSVKATEWVQSNMIEIAC